MSDGGYSAPDVAMIIQAAPNIQWRRCWDCRSESLYIDGVLPHCLCHDCGSMDTRLMKEPTRLLKTGQCIGRPSAAMSRPQKNWEECPYANHSDDCDCHGSAGER